MIRSVPLAALQTFSENIVRPQEWGRAQVDRLLQRVASAHAAANPTFLHLFGKAGTGKNALATVLLGAVSEGDPRCILQLSGHESFAESLFREACKGRGVGRAQLDLGAVYAALSVQECSSAMNITLEQYQSMARGDAQVLFTWMCGARGVPKYVSQALAGVPDARVVDAIANGGPAYVQANFRLPKLIVLVGNDRVLRELPPYATPEQVRAVNQEVFEFTTIPNRVVGDQ